MQNVWSHKISSSTFLVTGGAGFIGSHLVAYLLEHNAKSVRVLDNLSTGSRKNFESYLDKDNFSFIEGDIRNLETCRAAVVDVDYVLHQAALGSVPRSIENPILTNEVNIIGFLNMLVAAKDSKTLKRFVYAASSSTFGDNKILPKVEGEEGKPLSPYAITKVVNEYYADVFSKVYGFHTTGLRYFNIFGPRQSANNAYAAVIPIFCNGFIQDKPIYINGDGEASRDFTYVDNAVQANMKALFQEDVSMHEVYNVACGSRVTLNEMVTLLQEISKKTIVPTYREERVGDVKHSLASLEKIRINLGYEPQVNFKEGLIKVYQWYKENNIN